MAKNLFTVNKTGIPYQWSLDDVAGQADFMSDAQKKEKEKENALALNKGDAAYINSIKPKISQQSGNTHTIPLVTPDTDGVDYLSQLLTTPEQEAEYRKDNINAQKIALIGDALRQVGNVITTSKGAVPQQFSASPNIGLSAEYKADKEKRDANNLRYYSAKQQERIAEAKNALAKQEMQYKRAIDAFNMNYKISQAKQALAEAEAKRAATAEENAKSRKFTAEQNELNRRNATKNAYIRADKDTSNDVYGYQTPYGRGFKKRDFTATQIAQLYGYALKNKLFNEPEMAARLRALGLNKDTQDFKRQVVMDLLATNNEFADTVIDTYNLSVSDNGGQENGGTTLGLNWD